MDDPSKAHPKSIKNHRDYLSNLSTAIRYPNTKYPENSIIARMMGVRFGAILCGRHLITGN
ncbi:hypothetical protein Hanom_Chr04g00287841 [Helianthus anomalus]